MVARTGGKEWVGAATCPGNRIGMIIWTQNERIGWLVVGDEIATWLSQTPEKSMAADPPPASRRISTIIDPRPPASRSSSSYIVGSTPHYSNTRRHSLYGTEDRIIIDPGSKYWKVGFSGEGKPRQVYQVVQAEDEPTLWSWHSSRSQEEYEEADRMLAARLQDALRAVFFESLMTDPKSRKVIIVEHPLLPLRVKDLMARILFDNLNIPSLSFASSHMLALLAAGRTTGLVVDCGHLETTVLPISSSRPMYPLLRTTPRAGSRLTIYLRSLILEFGTYHPPFASLAGSVNSAPRPTRVPPEILTDALIEDIKTSCCFVGSPLDQFILHEPGTFDESLRREDQMDVDTEASLSHGQSLHVNPPSGRRSGTQSGIQSGMQSGVQSGTHTPSRVQDSWAAQYERQSSATDFLIPVTPPPPVIGTGRGNIRIPGWIRERAAEYLFSGGDVDEPSVAEVILQTLLKVPVDLRKRMISTILVIGGTPMLPGFIPRLHQELIRSLNKTPAAPSIRSPKRRAYDPFEPVRPLAPYVAILNNPSPPPSTSSSSQNAGKAPAFSPTCMAWVGGSLAGVLKTGGEEILHDRWDEAAVEDPEASFQDVLTKESSLVLPDWTRVPMVVGAPHAGKHAPRQFGLTMEEPIAA